MKKHYILCIFCLLCVLVLASSCRKDALPVIGAENYVVSHKNPIKKNNRKIISISSQITEIICDLGCMDRLIGRTDFCQYPPQVKKIEAIGGVNNPDVEKIISLKPDIVITSSITPQKTFVQIENAGFPILSFRESNKIEGMYKVIEILGKILQKEQTADSIITDCKQRLRKVALQCEKLRNLNKKDKPKVYYVVGFGPGGDFSAGKNTYINQMLELAGADNIAKTSNDWTFTKEMLFKQEPDYIFIRKDDKEKFCKTVPYNRLKAVQNGHVIGVDGIDTQTPRSISLIEFIANRIY